MRECRWGDRGRIFGRLTKSNNLEIQDHIILQNCNYFLRQNKTGLHILLNLVFSEWLPAIIVKRGHRRRINTEEKAKVVAAVWGNKTVSIPCRASYFVLGWLVLVRFILFFISSWCKYFKSSWCKIADAARNWVNSAPKAAATTFAFSSMRGAELLPAYVSGAGAGWHAGVAKLMAGAVALQQLDVGWGHLQ